MDLNLSLSNKKGDVVMLRIGDSHRVNLGLEFLVNQYLNEITLTPMSKQDPQNVR